MHIDIGENGNLELWLDGDEQVTLCFARSKMILEQVIIEEGTNWIGHRAHITVQTDSPDVQLDWESGKEEQRTLEIYIEQPRSKDEPAKEATDV